MQYREVFICKGFNVNASSLTTKTDALNANLNPLPSKDPSVPIGSPGMVGPLVKGTTKLFETEVPKAQGGKLIIHCESITGSGTVTPKLHAILVAPDGTTYDVVLNVTLSAITAAGDQCYDIENLPQNVYIAWGALTGTSLLVDAIMIVG